MANEDVTKLPKWAQDRLSQIDRVERENERLRQLVELAAPDGLMGEGRVYLPDNLSRTRRLIGGLYTAVEIEIPGRDKLAVQLTERGGAEVIEVKTFWSTISIEPVAGNVIRVKGERRGR